MKHILINVWAFAAGMLGLLIMCTTSSWAQKQIDAILTFNEYDVLYLTDFIDVKSQKISSTNSSISLALSVLGDNSKRVYVRMEVDVVLQGDRGSDPCLLKAKTGGFTVQGSRILAARDFANLSSDVRIVDDEYYENAALKKKIEDNASTLSTAPPGNYTVRMQVLDATTNQDIAGGWISKTITITQSTENETIVEITDPLDGTCINTLAPTFSWTTTASNVIVNVYEVGTNQHSPQDALTGNYPFLSQEVSGATTLTYPPNAPRKLEEGKAYVVQVQGIITTNRGEAKRSSKPITFRISDDKVGRMLEQLMNVIDGAAASTFNGLRSDPNNWIAWPAYGAMTLDGQTITEADLLLLTNTFIGKEDVQLSVENQ